MKNARSRNNLGVFVKSFNADVWYALVLYTSVFVFGVASVEVLVQTRRNSLMTNNVLQTMKKTSNFILRSIIGKRIPSEPKCCSNRIAFVSLVLAGFLFVTLYKAMLVAFVTVEIHEPPVRSFNEIKTSNYLLAVQKDTAMESIFTEASEESEEYKLEKEKKITRFTNGVEDYVNQMVLKENQKTNVILLYIYQIAQFSSHYPCNVGVIKETKHHVEYNAGMTFKKNWEFTHLINYHLLLMKEDGSLNRYYQPYLKVTQKSCPDEQTIRPVLKIPKPVSINTTFILYVLILSGIGCALVLLMMEIAHKRNEQNT